MKTVPPWGLFLIACLALGLVSPASWHAWRLEDETLKLASSFQPVAARPALPAADLDGNGLAERLELAGEQARLVRGSQVAWASPPAWQVAQAGLADLNRDGQTEAILLIWRTFEPWPVDRFLPAGGRIAGFHDNRGRSCHLVLIGWRGRVYGELWAGSALAEPLRQFAAADLDGDGRQELVTLDFRYSDPPGASAKSFSVWEWNGFGFTLLDRRPGPFSNFVLHSTYDNASMILTLP